MGLFDRNKDKDKFDSPSRMPEPPRSSNSLDEVKARVETPLDEMEEFEPDMSDVLEEKMEDSEEEPVHADKEPMHPSHAPSVVSPTLYIKLSEYKEVVESTNKMRSNIEKAKSMIGELRMIEKDEITKLKKSEDLVNDIEKIISLLEKTMITPIE